MSRVRCACGEPAIGVVIRDGESVVVGADCYRAECLRVAGDGPIFEGFEAGGDQ
jgi:hypothetical protein